MRGLEGIWPLTFIVILCSSWSSRLREMKMYIMFCLQSVFIEISAYRFLTRVSVFPYFPSPVCISRPQGISGGKHNVVEGLRRRPDTHYSF